MGRGVVVAVVGVDGSGKSTQAKRLVGRLREAGVPAVYLENAGGRPLWNRLAQAVGRRDGVHLFGRRGYPALEATVRWLALARAVAVTRLTGRVGVMDRWTWCQYVIMQARGDRGIRLVRAAYAFFPRPDLVCFLAVTPELARRRVLARGIDTEELAHLTALDAGYRALPEFGSFILIDGNADPATVAGALDRAVATVTGRR
ncbi:thymidylate kinase [Micromonospora sp. WMMD714]|uniref:dTMP kinase n=1 Tax=Micromonospora sp. WMMD714 TaxID=3016097 RepID=UPI00249BCE3C|nr:thymidylate kinase [Micromonospora sp. WMMD714]WFE66837.1 thymidylate kinase [Micromonospora sp. WMMD714]